MKNTKRLFGSISYFLLAVIVFGATGLAQSSILPPEASTIAKDIDNIFWFILYITGFFFLLVIALLLYFIIRYRAKKPGEEGINFHGHMGLEIAWTIVPAVFFIVIAIFSAGLLDKIHNPPADSMVVNVEGVQFGWNFQYPADNVTSNQTMVVPVNRPVLLMLRSGSTEGTSAVLHSFWVPAFRLKQDVLPNEDRELWFEAKELGEFPIRCAELCGAGHSNMLGTVKVVTAEEYLTWVEQVKQATSGLSDSAKRGMELASARGRGCIGCHTTNGNAGAGPTWLKLYGKTEKLDDGSEIVVNDEYIINSIRNPGAQIVQGFLPGVMPTYATGAVSDGEIADIIEYIKSLTGEAPQATTPPSTSEDETRTTPTESPETSSESTETLSPVDWGQQLTASCMGCHTITGAPSVGPTWLDLYGKTETLTDGTQVTVDDAYITQSIREPNAQVVQGFLAIMPPFASYTDEEIQAIIEYIKSLKTE